MAQNAKIIDITKSYVPVDPTAFPNNLQNTGKEDYPIQSEQIVAYNGYNFMPTSYGYKSFFGINAAVDIDALPSRCDKILLLQSNALINYFIALCENGIYMKGGEEDGAWVQVAEEDVPESGTHKNWTWALMGEELYCYRANSPTMWKIGPDAALEYPLDTARAVPTLDSIAYASGLAIGTWKYKYRVQNSSGIWTELSSEATVVLAAQSAVNVHCSTLAGDLVLRVIRTNGTDVKYKDIASPGANYILVDNALTAVANAWTTYVTADEVLASDVDPYTPVAQTPTFLNMEGQQGIFKAGQRLGFWDSENSTAWSSIDEFTDFTPSIQTLAGSAIFGDINGNIVNILPYNEGFVIYATKSIILVKAATEATFQWNPTVLLSEDGIAYLNQAASSSPNDKHFAWTGQGLYRIENDKAEPIVPEFYDYVKQFDTPVFLDILEGRYLFIQTVDQDLVYGNVEFTVNEVEPVTINIPVNEWDATFNIPGVTIKPSDFCGLLSSFAEQSDQEAQVASDIEDNDGEPPDQSSGHIRYTPIYTAYLSPGIYPNPLDVTWDSTPCGSSDFEGTPWPMSPNIETIASLGNGPTGKLVFSSENLSMAIFIQLQMALWNESDSNMENVLSMMRSRGFSDTKTEASGSTETVDSYSDCIVGSFPSDFSEPEFGYNFCSFWLSRNCIQHETFTARTHNTVDTTNTPSQSGQMLFTGTMDNFGAGPYTQGQGRTALEAVLAIASSVNPGGGNASLDRTFVQTGSGSNMGITGELRRNDTPLVNAYPTVGAYTSTTCPTGFTASSPGVCTPNVAYTKNYFRGVEMVSEKVAALSGPDVGYCYLSHWKYLGEDGEYHTVPATNACSAPGYEPPAEEDDEGNNNNPLPPIPEESGTVCGIDYEPVSVPGATYDPIEWPTQSITIPGGQFLLQEGSADPIYPTYRGAFVYDMHLKKWGKLKADYKLLVEFSPLNGSYNNTVPYERFLVEAGILSTEGLIYLFDESPADSWIKYGKIGYYRLGMTNLEEFKVQMRGPSDFSIQIEASLTGKSPEFMLGSITEFADTDLGVVYYDKSARWYSISIKGKYDIQHMEFRGTLGGRR